MSVKPFPENSKSPDFTPLSGEGEMPKRRPIIRPRIPNFEAGNSERTLSSQESSSPDDRRIENLQRRIQNSFALTQTSPRDRRIANLREAIQNYSTPNQGSRMDSESSKSSKRVERLRANLLRTSTELNQKKSRTSSEIVPRRNRGSSLTERMRTASLVTMGRIGSGLFGKPIPLPEATVNFLKCSFDYIKSIFVRDESIRKYKSPYLNNYPPINDFKEIQKCFNELAHESLGSKDIFNELLGTEKFEAIHAKLNRGSTIRKSLRSDPKLFSIYEEESLKTRAYLIASLVRSLLQTENLIPYKLFNKHFKNVDVKNEEQILKAMREMYNSVDGSRQGVLIEFFKHLKSIQLDSSDLEMLAKDILHNWPNNWSSLRTNVDFVVEILRICIEKTDDKDQLHWLEAGDLNFSPSNSQRKD